MPPGTHIAEHLARLGQTEAWLYQAAGISQDRWSRLRRGVARQFRYREARAIARALGVRVGAVFEHGAVMEKERDRVPRQ